MILKGMTHTRENDASVIFLCFTFTFGKSSDIESDNKKCLLNLWSTRHKYISLTETTSIHCCLIYLIQLYLINVASYLSKGNAEYV